MPGITIISRSGEARQVDATEGLTLMEVIRDNGFDELEAMCGGCCSCATCHVYIVTGATDKLPAMSENENDLLDGSEHRKAESRLSCQIPVTAGLEGMRVEIAPED